MHRQETRRRAPVGGAPSPDPLAGFCAEIRAATRQPTDWQVTAVDLADALGQRPLPLRDDVLGVMPAGARDGSDRSITLHVEPDGSFSVVALVARPGQATSIHDHTTWCVVALIAGIEREERFTMDPTGAMLLPGRVSEDGRGAVNGFAPPGDIHRVTNIGDELAVSLHVYGTDLSRIGNSVRRTYHLPVADPTPSVPGAREGDR